MLEESPGENTDFEEIAHMVQEDVAYATQNPDAAKPRQLEENSLRSQEDASSSVASFRECDAGPVSGLIKNLRFDRLDLMNSINVSVLLILGSRAQDSVHFEPERTTVRERCAEVR